LLCSSLCCFLFFFVAVDLSKNGNKVFFSDASTKWDYANSMQRVENANRESDE
jgi:hypothetical protein